ncbi:hypothetical protein L208DRAFT_1383676 [Tricholoma matsutake]|nr:hypothetical protein L208DRAFT_1383676 [Tricholoma matsutake 945]
MLKRIAGLQNKEQPLSTADQMNKDLDTEDVEGLGENDEQEEDKEDEEDEEDKEDEEEESDESNESLVELDLDGEEGGEDEYNILGFAAF